MDPMGSSRGFAPARTLAACERFRIYGYATMFLQSPIGARPGVIRLCGETVGDDFYADGLHVHESLKSRMLSVAGARRSVAYRRMVGLAPALVVFMSVLGDAPIGAPQDEVGL